jgi:iron complex transport system substrate-binding protein
MILSLKPDLVFLLKEHSSIASFLTKNGIAFRVIDDENFCAILQSFRVIGGLFGKTREADSLVQSAQVEIVDTTAAADRPKILLCVDRDDPGTGAIAKVYIAGPKSFYNQLIKYAGGANASADSSFEYPSFSAEGIIRLAPDIIVDLTTSAAGVRHDKVRDDWKALSMVPAVKNRLVFLPNGDYMTIPGPRIAMILKEIKRTVKEFRKERGKQ